MNKENIRNIAIIAHVDHGKTTLVDSMLKQSGLFRDNQEVMDRVMDSMDLERERGITIAAKNTAVLYDDLKINIVDTPGHADFGGEVERSLNLVDGTILLVDSSEGPLPQTRFVVKKSLDKNLPMIVVINKIDRPDTRIEEVLNEVYDLFIDLDASEEQIEFPVLYTNAKAGIAHHELGDENTDLRPLMETIRENIPCPGGKSDVESQFLVTNLDYDSYVGQIAIGRLTNGKLSLNRVYAHYRNDEEIAKVKLSNLYTFSGLAKTKVTEVECGDIIAFSGVVDLKIGDSITCMDNPKPLPSIKVDEPTVSMIFAVNDGPFAGLEGKYVTARQIQDRLIEETLRNVSLRVEKTDRADAFKVCGRGELQLAVLIETMRRQGYEFTVSKPQVITKEEDGKLLEPFEKVYLDIPEESVGTITSKLSERKGIMENLINKGSGRAMMEFIIPSRGLIGFRSQFLTDTRGAGIMNSLFGGFKPHAGNIMHRKSGALVADRKGRVTAYASLAMEDRGDLFIEVGTQVYSGMVVGERNRNGDLEINITKEKKLTNVRSAFKENTVVLKKPRPMSLDQSIEFISEDELLEITPENIRLRKTELDSNKRIKKLKQ